MGHRLAAVLVFALVAAGCSDDAATPEITTTTAVTPIAPTTTLPSTSPVLQPSDLDLTLAENPLLTEGTWPGPAWPTSLDGVAFADIVPSGLTAALGANGFVIDGNETWSHLTWLYSSVYPYGERPVFVTTDAAYHHWHLTFDRILRAVEEETLLPILERFTAAMVDATRAQAAELASTPAADAASRAAAFYEATATVLGLDVGPIADLAQTEVALVLEHSSRTGSPTLGGDCAGLNQCIDYSLMTPRGHYTRSEDLTRYFRAMSLLGNGAALLTDLPGMRISLLTARVLTTDPDLTADWASIYFPTAFLVGAADDYTPFEAATAAETVIPGWVDDPTLLDDAAVAAVGIQLAATRQVRIDPESASVRPMGARFVFDSWVLDQLADPGIASRTRVSALDLAAAFGSDWALQRQVNAGEAAEWPAYLDGVTAMRAAVDGRTIDDWAATAYGAWLHALEPMWQPHGATYPPFMQTEAWAAKDHQTGFGSWAELRHDTILYAKQGMAEGDMEPPAAASHWVEPDPVAFQRISDAARLLRSGLTQLDLLTGTTDDVFTPLGMLDRLITMTDRMASIATTELAGNPISTDDNEFLGQIGGWFESILYASGGDSGEIDAHGALIADVFLDAQTDMALEVATGDFNTIYVLVPDRAGGFEVATGGVYSYYEFWQPRDDRLTDEAWWESIESASLPDRPSWATDHLGL